nr:hypothetical protein [Acidimicrobiia bacterium]
ALGDFNDDPVRLGAAITYLERAVPRDEMLERRLAELRTIKPAWEVA